MSIDTDLAACWKANTGVVLIDSGPEISSVQDQSGNGHTLTTDSGREPEIDNDGDIPMIEFLGNKYLIIPSTLQINTQDCAIYVCAETNSFDSGGMLLVRLNGNINGNINFWLEKASGQVARLRFKNLPSLLHQATSRITYATNSGASSSLQQIGPEVFSSGAASLSNANLGGFVGTQNGSVNFFSGRIIEIRIYDSEKTAAEHQEILDYFQVTYGSLSSSEKVFWLCAGDSLEKGNSANEQEWPAQYARLQSTQPKMQNSAIGGRLAVTLDSEFNTRDLPELNEAGDRYETVFYHLWAGTNDISGTTPTIVTITNALDSIISKAKAAGAITIINTITPRTDFDAAEQVRRAAVNSHIRSGATGADMVIDVAADPRLDDANDSLYYTDGIHMTRLGYGSVAQLVDNQVGQFLENRNRRTGISIFGGARSRTRRGK